MSARLDACHGKAGAVLALVFVVGLTSGLLLGTHLLTPPPTIEDVHRARVNSTLTDLIDHLDLHPDQSEEVRQVLDDMIMTEADLYSQVKQNQMDGRMRIMRVLQPEQQEQFVMLLEGESDSD